MIIHCCLSYVWPFFILSKATHVFDHFDNGVGDRNSEATEAIAGTGVITANQGVQEGVKPKRKIVRPSYLSDYV